MTDTNQTSKKITGTVCFIIEDDRVLLAEIEHPDGRRLWNGIGGVVDPGETPAQAVVREIAEETMLEVREEDAHEACMIELENLDLHVFTAREWGGLVKVIDPTLKQLQWFQFDAVPYHAMHEGNTRWLPAVLQG